MQDDESFKAIEQRLRDEAKQLLRDCSQKQVLDSLKTRFQRSNQRRSILLAASAASIFVVMGWIGIQRILQSGNPAADRVVGVEQSPLMEADVPLQPSISNLLSSQVDFSEEQSHQDRHGSIPTMFLMKKSNSDSEFVIGWYIPEQVEAIDTDDFSLGELEAIAHLLGTDFDSSRHDIIFAGVRTHVR